MEDRDDPRDHVRDHFGFIQPSPQRPHSLLRGCTALYTLYKARRGGRRWERMIWVALFVFVLLAVSVPLSVVVVFAGGDELLILVLRESGSP